MDPNLSGLQASSQSDNADWLTTIQLECFVETASHNKSLFIASAKQVLSFELQAKERGLYTKRMPIVTLPDISECFIRMFYNYVFINKTLVKLKQKP